MRICEQPDTRARSRVWRTVCCVLAAALTGVHAAGATIYVDAAATGEGDGTSWTDAYTTIQAAVDDPLFASGTDNRIEVAGGVYTEQVLLAAAHSGGFDATNRIVAKAGEEPILDGDGAMSIGITISNALYLAIEGLTVRNYDQAGIAIIESDHCTLRDVVVHGNAADGVYLVDSPDTVIRGATLFANGSNGLWMLTSPRLHVLNSRLHDNAVHGIRVGDGGNHSGGTDLLIRECMLYNNQERGIMLDCRNIVVLVEFSTFYRHGHNGIYVHHHMSVDVENCIFVGHHRAVFETASAATMAVRDSLFFGNGFLINSSSQNVTSEGLQEGDPSFVDAPNGDFRLFTDSPAIGAASDGRDLGALPDAAAVPVPTPTTYYVRPDGNDGNDGLGDTPGSAFQTIQKAASEIAGGDLVLIGAGAYAGQVTVDAGGAATQPTVFRATGAVTLAGGDHGIHLSGVHNVVLDGVEVHGASGHGVLLDGAYGCVVTNSIVRDNTGDGFYFLSSGGNRVVDSVSHGNRYGLHADGGGDNTLLRVVIRHNSSDGVRANDSGGGRGHGWLLAESEIRNNGARGVHLAGDRVSRFWSVSNCVVIANATDGFRANHRSGADVRNSIIANNLGNGLTQTSAGHMTEDYNNVFANGSNYGSSIDVGENSISADPAFVSVADADFHLYANSPCIGVGIGGVDMGRYPHGPVIPLPAPETYYVHPDGDDGNSGTGETPGEAFQTIGHAVGQLVPGGSVIVMSGTYSEDVTVSVSGNADAPVTIQAAGDVTVTGAASAFTLGSVSHIRLLGFNVTASGASGIVFDGAANCVISNVTSVANAGNGAELKNGGGHTIVDSTFSSNSGHGLFLFSSSNNQFLRSRFAHNTGSGLQVGANRDGGGAGTVLRECLLTENGVRGIYLNGDLCREWLIDQCVVFANNNEGIRVGQFNSITNRNTIFVGNGLDAMVGTGNTVSTNIHCNVIGNGRAYGTGFEQGLDDMAGNPSFVDAWKGDFRLYDDSPSAGTGAGGTDMGLYPAGPRVATPVPTAYFVRTDGSDANDGLGDSPTDAFASIAHALSVVAPGDSVTVGAGTFNEDVVLSTSGSATRPTILRGDAAGTIIQASTSGVRVAEASNVHVEGVHVTGGSGPNIRLDRTAFCELRDCESTASGSDGLYLDRAAATRVEAGTFHGNARDGIRIVSGARCELHNTVLANNGGAGIRAETGDAYCGGLLARQCLIYGNGARGVSQASHWGPFAWVVENSVVHGNTGHGLFHRLSVGLTLRNSIVTANTGAGLASESDPGNYTLEHNNIYGNDPDYQNSLAPDAGSISADPLFLDPGAGDFQLDVQSPCVNTGTNQVWMIGAFDLAGAPRIQNEIVDMGAYETFIPPPGTLFLVR